MSVRHAMLPRALTCCVIAGLLSPGTAVAQRADSPPRPRPWTTVELRAGVDALSDGYAGWNEQEVRIDHRVTGRSGAGFSIARLSRFDRVDRRVTVDASLAVARRATLAIEGELSPTHAAVPRYGAEARVHASLGAGWGVEVGAGQRHFTDATLRRGVVTLERYWGRWLVAYAASRGHLSGVAGTSGHVVRLTRFVFARNDVSVGLFTGREAETVADGNVLVMRVRGAAIWGDVPLSSRVAVTYRGSRTRQGDLYQRNSISLGLQARLD